jgi:hypothetical protein
VETARETGDQINSTIPIQFQQNKSVRSSARSNKLKIKQTVVYIFAENPLLNLTYDNSQEARKYPTKS